MTEWTVNNKLNDWYQKQYHIKLPKKYETKSRLYFSTAPVSSFSPIDLFATGSKGIWLDPSDLSTMFSDRAGTTPVTAPGTVVGLRLDKSKNGVGTNGASRRNLFERTEEIDNAYWTKDGATVPTTNNTAPDGTATADALTETATTGFHGTYRVPAGTFTAGAYVLSCYFKQGTARYAHLLLNTSAGYSAATFDLQDGLVTKNQTGGTGVTSPSLPTITAIGTSGWYRATITATTTANVNAVGPLLSNSGTPTYTATGGVSYAGSTANNILVWGAQLELASTVSTYQKIIADWPSTMAGNHAVAPTDAARPIYGVEPKGGRRNLLTWSEGFNVAPWILFGAGAITADTAASPTNEQTADTLTFGSTTSQVYQNVSTAAAQYTLSVWVRVETGTKNFRLKFYNGSADSFSSTFTATTVWQRFSHTFTGAVAAGTNIAICNDNVTLGSVYAWGAQLELGSTATAYQRVTTAYDVTESGVATCHYVQYDGSDDSMSTAAIDFTATDKMSVFAGVRKLSDAAQAILVELTASAAANNGAFNVQAPIGGSGEYRFVSKGTVSAFATSSALPAPRTNILTGLADIGADSTILRVNGAQVEAVTTDQGTGNYSAQPLYIGRRGGSSAPFSGRDYGIVIVGKAASAGEITDTETWLADKTAQVTL